MTSYLRWCRLGLLAVLASVAVVGPARAEEYSGRTPPRLSLTDGQVWFWKAGASEWENAQVNLPLAPGDFLYTGDSSRAEIQIGPRAFVRCDSATQFGLTSQDKGLLQVELSQGRAALDLRDLESGARVELDTPDGKLDVTHPGLYDATVSSDHTSFAARQGGRATIIT